MKRSPAAAVCLSLLPGLGHVYVGYRNKGILLIVLAFAAIQITSEVAAPFGVVIGFVWLFAMIDAYRSAEEWNRVVEAGGQPPKETPFGFSKWWGWVLIALGVLFTLDNLGLRLDWVWNFWPVGLILMGIYVLKAKPAPAPAATPEPTPGEREEGRPHTPPVETPVDEPDP